MFNKQLSNPRSKILKPHSPIKLEPEELESDRPYSKPMEFKNMAAGHSMIFLVGDGKNVAKARNPQEAVFLS